jgi:carbon-monoxide dehydrogenase large subunit
MKFGFGQTLKRKEDAPLLLGKGCYVADVSLPGALHAVVARSPHAHARFTIHDLARVRAMPGVRLVLTGADVAGLGPMPCLGVLPGVETDVRPYPVLCRDVVRYVGDAVAFVVADTLEQAKDAAEAVTIDWQPLPHIVGAVEALKSGAVSAWEGSTNLAFEVEEGDADATKQAFAQAARVIEITIINQRLVTNYMDTRGVVAEYDGDRYTLTLGSQGAHIIRDVIGGMVMKLPPERMRVITQDVGGGFGTKLFPYREYALAAVATERTAKPVKWVCDRSEHFLADSQGRDNISTARLALDANNRIIGLEIDIIADMGAYLHCYAPYIPWLGVGMATGVYDIPAAHVRLRSVYTNTVPVDAYRGAGRPEAAYLIERAVDAAARELGVAPDLFRKKNFIKPKAMPYTTPTGKVYDSGDFAGIMARAGARRLGWLQETRCRVEARRSPARHRPCHLHRSLWQQRAGNRACTAGEGRQRDRIDRLAIKRAGARHFLCAACRRAARPAARKGERDPGRHRPDRERRRHRRLQLDPNRWRLGGSRQQDPRRPAQGDRRRRAGSVDRRFGDRRWRHPRCRHR